MRLLLVSEGARDIGGDASGIVRQGAVRVLTARVLAEKFRREVRDSEIEAVPLIRLHRGGGYEAKVRLHLRDATRDNKTGVAIVVDRDRTDRGERLRLLREGRGSAEQDPVLATLARKCALGVAIETVEAWLLADEAGLSRGLGYTILRQPAPEGLNGGPGTPSHPKARLEELIRESEMGVGAAYDAVARFADLEIVQNRCAEGFRSYADELRARVE